MTAKDSLSHTDRPQQNEVKVMFCGTKGNHMDIETLEKYKRKLFTVGLLDRHLSSVFFFEQLKTLMK